MFLDRSGECPLSLEIRDPGGTPPELWSILASQMYRLATAHRVWIDTVALDAIQSVFRAETVNMPLLEDLQIGFSPPHVAPHIDGPCPILHPNLACLRSLSSNAYPWKVVRAWIMPTLTSLVIVGRADTSGVPLPTLAEWCDLLQSLSLLESLRLVDAVAPVDSQTDITLPVYLQIALPNLQRATLVSTYPGTMRAYAWMLIHVASPWTTHICLKNTDPFSETDLFASPIICLLLRIRAIVYPAMSAEPSKPFLKAWIAWAQEKFTLGFRRSHSADESRDSPPILEIISQLNPFSTGYRSATERLFEQVCSEPLYDTTHLAISNLGTRLDGWVSLDQPHVAYMGNSKETSSAFLEALEQSLSEDNPREFLPHLYCLTVRGKFSLPSAKRLPAPSSVNSSSSRCHRPPLLQRLADALQQRQQRGLGSTLVDVGTGILTLRGKVIGVKVFNPSELQTRNGSDDEDGLHDHVQL